MFVAYQIVSVTLQRLLNNCGMLQSLPELPVSLWHMDASYCTLLETIPTQFNRQAGQYTNSIASSKKYRTEVALLPNYIYEEMLAT